ncbi:PD-(D/E)XK nuclease family protein [Lentzea xinjiangensis]|uniref:PD-(D/E)XK nuclease family protein n=1 Tax=Lentzea xinjiangensis TaxID=402600 RepID=UPI0015A58AA4|nr:PD-(D/E)XK nuclease family protein [Lentzea xinjiangensis]
MQHTDHAVDGVLDLVEFRGRSAGRAQQEYQAAEGRRCDSGLLRWAEHAVGQYLRASAELPAVPGAVMAPWSREWAIQYEQGGLREFRVQGRRYASADGRIRELRIMHTGSLEDRGSDPAVAAVAAYVLAFGRPVLGGKWDVPLVVGKIPTEVDRIRVIDIGLLDGSWNVVFDGDRNQASAAFRTEAFPSIKAIADGREFRPGNDCARCYLRRDCPALPRRAGLLGIQDTTRRARSFSITNGRQHDRCPRQSRLRELWLPYPKEAEYDEAARLGQAVHEWLEHAHRRSPDRACGPRETPSPPDDWSVGRWAVRGDSALLGVQLIGDHALICPLRTGATITGVRPEHSTVVYDPDADVVVHAKSDLVYTDGDVLVVRETKTTSQEHERDLLRRYPQIALAVVLAAERVLGDDPALTRVELELLTPAGPFKSTFHPADPGLVQAAREVVHDLAAAWHADTEWAPRPGWACGRCEVSRWCPDRLNDTGDTTPGDLTGPDLGEAE